MRFVERHLPADLGVDLVEHVEHHGAVAVRRHPAVH
jgi:hypothetical protein